jgi:putative ABC transport system permease protein
MGVGKQGSSQNSFFVPLNWARAVRTVHFYAGSDLKTTDQVASDGYTTVLVKVDSANDVKSVASAIDSLGYGEVSTAAEVDRLQQVSTVMWVILGSVAAIAIVAAALGVVNTMLMAVSEQRYTIGVWRAFGARRAQIARQFLLEAALLGLVGGAVGAGLGTLIGHFVNQRVSSLLQAQGLSVTSVSEIPLWLLAGAIALTTLFGVIAGLYPAWRAARQDPAEALSSAQ